MAEIRREVDGKVEKKKFGVGSWLEKFGREVFSPQAEYFFGGIPGAVFFFFGGRWSVPFQPTRSNKNSQTRARSNITQSEKNKKYWLFKIYWFG